MTLWAAISILYFVIACFFYRVIACLKKSLSERKHYVRHPERLKQEFGGFWTDFFVAAFWPLQLVGVLVFLFRRW